jgi:hypothetical protein
MLSVRVVMDEETCGELFPDCERGLIPPWDELYWIFCTSRRTLLSWRETLARHTVVST